MCHVGSVEEERVKTRTVSGGDGEGERRVLPGPRD